jgi:hypothetical protein
MNSMMFEQAALDWYYRSHSRMKYSAIQAIELDTMHLDEQDKDTDGYFSSYQNQQLVRTIIRSQRLFRRDTS